MFKLLEAEGSVLGAEISGEYTKADVEEFKKAFDERVAEGHERINVLAKIDELSLWKVHLNAFIEDTRFVMAHSKELRHIAIVGHSKIVEVLVNLDNKIMGKPDEELVERYFDVADLDKAWEFIRS